VTGPTVQITNGEVKASLIQEHAEEIARQFAITATALQIPNTSENLSSYKDYLQTGNIPSSWTALGIQESQPVNFFETRAMIPKNTCMNKVE
jgi:hypothetical protein